MAHEQGSFREGSKEDDKYALRWAITPLKSLIGNNEATKDILLIKQK